MGRVTRRQRTPGIVSTSRGRALLGLVKGLDVVVGCVKRLLCLGIQLWV